MIWRVYDKTDTLLETFSSNLDYTGCTTIQLYNGKTYNITYAYKIDRTTDGIIYVE